MQQTPYIYTPRELFTRKLEQIKLSDPPGHARIIKVIDRLLSNPQDADGKMHGNYGGRMKKYVGRGGYRLIYYWCQQCRKENRRLEINCADCDVIPDNSVIFFDLYHKNAGKKQ